jgi:hypothetical protein
LLCCYLSALLFHAKRKHRRSQELDQEGPPTSATYVQNVQASSPTQTAQLLRGKKEVGVFSAIHVTRLGALKIRPQAPLLLTHLDKNHPSRYQRMLPQCIEMCRARAHLSNLACHFIQGAKHQAGVSVWPCCLYSFPQQSSMSRSWPNWLVKLTPTGCACWYPPLRSGAPYLGR